MRKVLAIIIIFLLNISATIIAEGADKQLIAGAGPSTFIVELFAKEFTKLPAVNGYKFKVPLKSSKHAGGILSSDKYLFGRTGRPLNDKEKNMNKEQIFLARIPIVIVAGDNVGVTSLTLDQLEGIFTGSITNWSQVGGIDEGIYLIGREPTEALFTTLKKEFPFFKETKFHKVVKKDNYVLNILNNSPLGKYAIGFGAKPNFQGMNVLDIQGFSAGVGVGLVYDLKNKNHRIVKAAIDFSKGEYWAEKVSTTGSLPPLK